LTPSSSKEKAILCARAALDHKAIDLAMGSGHLLLYPKLIVGLRLRL
jgi:hypothetical protein